MAFEKGSILFNIGVLYAQKGARRVRNNYSYNVLFHDNRILFYGQCDMLNCTGDM